ncbi:MAG: phospholipase A [Bacteroidales bacterium]|nr:phospholipase A [Bacteroidales bacterium]
MTTRKSCLFIAVALLFAPGLSLRAQSLPRIDMLRPVYIIAGIPLSEEPTRSNFDIKFQYSFAIPVCDDIADTGISLSVGYTQISLWNILGVSMPFYEHTFMPGIYARKEWKAVSGTRTLSAGFEHRSNGRDDAYSRSQNYVFITYIREYDNGIRLKANARPGWGDYGKPTVLDMPLRYTGYIDFGFAYESKSFPLGVQLDVTPIYNKSIANVTAGLTCRLSANPMVPQLYVQLHYGYDDALRDCMNENGPIIYPDGIIPYIPGEPLAPRTCIRAGLRLGLHEYVF